MCGLHSRLRLASNDGDPKVRNGGQVCTVVSPCICEFTLIYGGRIVLNYDVIAVGKWKGYIDLRGNEFLAPHTEHLADWFCLWQIIMLTENGQNYV